MNERSFYIDFLKGFLIVLMVLFHLDFFTSNIDENITSVVYCFHMPAFLLVSGFLFNADKSWSKFAKSIVSLGLIYVVFELLYLLGVGFFGSILGSSNNVDLSLGNILNKVFQAPSGTYWYLHTIILCMIPIFLINKIGLSDISKYVLSYLLIAFLCLGIEGLKSENILYFMLGYFLRFIGKPINDIIKPTLFSFLAFVVIVYSTEFYNRFSICGIGSTFVSISSLFYIYERKFNKLSQILCFVGSNSLSIVIFSPLFTIFSKIYSRFFNFNYGWIVWTIVTLVMIITISILMAKFLDKFGISKFLFRRNLYVDQTYYCC